MENQILQALTGATKAAEPAVRNLGAIPEFLKRLISGYEFPDVSRPKITYKGGKTIKKFPTTRQFAGETLTPFTRNPAKAMGQRAKILKKAVEVNPAFDPLRDFSDELVFEVQRWVDLFQGESAPFAESMRVPLGPDYPREKEFSELETEEAKQKYLKTHPEFTPPKQEEKGGQSNILDFLIGPPAAQIARSLPKRVGEVSEAMQPLATGEQLTPEQIQALAPRGTMMGGVQAVPAANISIPAVGPEFAGVPRETFVDVLKQAAPTVGGVLGGATAFGSGIGIGLGLNKLLGKQEPEEAPSQPKVEEQPEEMAMDDPLRRLNQDNYFEKDELSERVWVDPFGNQFMVSSEGKFVPGFFGPNTEERQAKQQEFFERRKALYEKSNEELQAITSEVDDLAPVLENEQFALYAVRRRPDVQSKQEMLEEENIKRLAYNLDPLKKAPDWLGEAYKQQFKPENSVSLVLENKQDGSRRVISSDWEDRLVQHSISFTQETSPGSFGLEVGQREPKIFPTHRRLLNLKKNAPREVLDKLDIERFEPGKFEFRQFSYLDEDGKKRTVRIDDSVYKVLERLEEQNRGFPFPIPIDDIEDDEIGRFNLFEQMKAMPKFLKMIKGKNNPYLVDIGLKRKVPSLKKQKEMVRNFEMQIEPSIVRLTTPATEPAPSLLTPGGTGPFISKLAVTDEGLETTQEPRMIAGSGFVYDTNKILTAAHVAETLKPGESYIETMDGKRFKVKDILLHSSKDLAFVRTEGAGDLKPLKIGNVDELKPDMFTASYGFPEGEELEGRPGIVTSTGRFYGGELERLFRGFPGWKPSEIETSNVFSGGQSGGPVLNAKGEVIGIISGSYKYPKRGLIIPASEFDRIISY